MDDVSALGVSRTDKVWVAGLLGGGGMVLLLASPWLVPVAGAVAGRRAVHPLRTTPWNGSGRWSSRGPAVVVVHRQGRRALERSRNVGVHQDGNKVGIDGEQGRGLLDRAVEARRDVAARRPAGTAPVGVTVSRPDPCPDLG